MLKGHTRYKYKQYIQRITKEWKKLTYKNKENGYLKGEHNVLVRPFFNDQLAITKSGKYQHNQQQQQQMQRNKEGDEK